jgi:virulence factor
MKVGVIGTGNMGENHIRTYLSLTNVCEFIGIYDTDERKKLHIANKYQVKPFASMEELLQTADAVSIAVPTEYHYKVGLACIDHRVHMLMEKPIANTIPEAKELDEKARQANVKLQVGHIELYNPFIQTLANKIEEETILAIDFKRMSPYSNRVESFDVVKDLMIHDLYILHAFLKDSITDFQAFGKVTKNIPKHAAVIVKSKKGAIAQLTASYFAKQKMRTIQILTDKALYEADILNRKIVITQSVNERTSNIPVSVKQVVYVDDSLQPLKAELIDFIRCTQQDREPFVTAKDGIHGLCLANQISEVICK